jgi:parallel beta-helix repeat protein
MTYVPITRIGAASGLLALVGGIPVMVAAAGPAEAASCTAPVRYTASSNTIYLTGGKSFTPAQILAACPTAPLQLVDANTRTWLLSADLVVQQGSKLVLKGAKAGGQVDNLRIRSLASNKATEVQQITAGYGTIEIDSVKITSWDTATNAPDTDHNLPDTAAATDRGRAFIRALSTLAPDGKTAQVSRMTIRNSTISRLGYYGAEAYGVSYKARGCDRDHVAICKKLTVGGEQTNSIFDRNYMGTYTWGAKGIKFKGNTYSNNISYGLDPHDVSTSLTIDRNRFTYNGNHGLICSQLCDKLTITNNTSDHNGVRPTDAVGDGDEAERQVHGIMLHRGVTNSKITGNTVTDQTTGAGIAIFDSSKNSVSKNTLKNNLYGIRLSVGAANNTFKDNTVTDSIQNAIYMFRGSDAVEYTTRSGNPTNNVFTNTTISGTGSYGVRLLDADKNRIEGKSMTRVGGPLIFTRAAGNTIKNVKLSARQPVTVTGSATAPSSLTIYGPRDSVVVTADKYSRVSYR